MKFSPDADIVVCKKNSIVGKVHTTHIRLKSEKKEQFREAGTSNLFTSKAG